MAVDITVHHQMPSLSSPDPSQLAAHFRAVATRKERLYSTVCRDNNWRFAPMVLDAWGGIHGDSWRLWKSITHAATTGMNEAARAEEVTTIRRTLAMKLAQAVATQLELLHMTQPTPVLAFPAVQWTKVGEDDAGNEIWDT